MSSNNLLYLEEVCFRFRNWNGRIQGLVVNTVHVACLCIYHTVFEIHKSQKHQYKISILLSFIELNKPIYKVAILGVL
jgi:hypothetical protein